MTRKIAYILSLAVLLFSGVVGVYNGITEWGDAATPLQKSVTIGVFLYGVSGLLAVFGLLRRNRWGFYCAIIWAIAVTYVPGAAVMGYAEEGATLGAAIASSVGAGLIAVFVLWSTRERKLFAPNATPAAAS